MSQSLLDFVYDLESDSYKTEGLTQQEYIDRINTGKGDLKIDTTDFEFIDLEKMLGETTPAGTDDVPL